MRIAIILLLTVSIALLNPKLQAQKTSKFAREHSFGISGGIDLSKYTFKPTVLQDFKIGPTMGVTWRYIEEKYFGIQAELLYTNRGWKERLEDHPDLHFSRTLNYLEIPVLSHIYFGNDRIKAFVNLGPKIGLYLSESKATNIETTIPNYSNEQHSLEIANKFDYGITAGAGVELRMGKQSILLEGRYYFGLGDIFPNEKKDHFETSSNQNISISATYLFHIKRKK